MVEAVIILYIIILISSYKNTCTEACKLPAKNGHIASNADAKSTAVL